MVVVWRGYVVVVVGELDWLGSAALIEIAIDAIDFVRIEAENLGEPRDNRLAVLQPVRNNIHAQRDAVVGYGLAIPIDDPATARRDKRQVDAIAFGQQVVAVAIDDRDVAHPNRKQAADRQLRPTQKDSAAREGEALHTLCHQR